MAIETGASPETFNLIDQPWIKVLQDGQECLVSLRELFQRAEQFSEVCGDLPTQDVAILRWLIAITIRGLGLWDRSRWLAAMRGQLGPDQVLSYLQTHHDRFDLLHPDHPILVSTHRVQFSGHDEPQRWWEGAMALLPMGRTTGAGNTLRPFRTDVDMPLSEAARWLVHAQTFNTKGRKSGINGSSGYGPPSTVGNITSLCHVTGENLWQTILMNVVPGATSAEDLPVWERPHQDTYEGRKELRARTITGTCDLYTMRPRVIAIRHQHGRLTGARVGAGEYGDFDAVGSSGKDGARQSRAARRRLLNIDPMTCGYVQVEGKGESETRELLLVGRAAPRGRSLGQVETIFRQVGNADGMRQKPSQVASLMDSDVARAGVQFPLILQASITSMNYDDKVTKVLGVVHHSVDLPTSVLADDSAADTVIGAVERWQVARTLLSELVRDVIRASRPGADTTIRGSQSVEEGFDYEASMEFEDWLADLAGSPEPDTDAAEAQWAEALFHLLHQHADRVLQALRPDQLLVLNDKSSRKPTPAGAMKEFQKWARRRVPPPWLEQQNSNSPAAGEGDTEEESA